MKLIERKISVHPCHFSCFSVLIHDLLHGVVESLTERTFRVRVLHNFNRRVWIATNMVIFAYWLHLLEISSLLCHGLLWSNCCITTAGFPTAVDNCTGNENPGDDHSDWHG